MSNYMSRRDELNGNAPIRVSECVMVTVNKSVPDVLKDHGFLEGALYTHNAPSVVLPYRVESNVIQDCYNDIEDTTQDDLRGLALNAYLEHLEPCDRFSVENQSVKIKESVRGPESEDEMEEEPEDKPSLLGYNTTQEDWKFADETIMSLYNGEKMDVVTFRQLFVLLWFLVCNCRWSATQIQQKCLQVGLFVPRASKRTMVINIAKTLGQCRPSVVNSLFILFMWIPGVHGLEEATRSFFAQIPVSISDGFEYVATLTAKFHTTFLQFLIDADNNQRVIVGVVIVFLLFAVLAYTTMFVYHFIIPTLFHLAVLPFVYMTEFIKFVIGKVKNVCVKIVYCVKTMFGIFMLPFSRAYYRNLYNPTSNPTVNQFHAGELVKIEYNALESSTFVTLKTVEHGEIRISVPIQAIQLFDQKPKADKVKESVKLGSVLTPCKVWPNGLIEILIRDETGATKHQGMGWRTGDFLYTAQHCMKLDDVDYVLRHDKNYYPIGKVDWRQHSGYLDTTAIKLEPKAWSMLGCGSLKILNPFSFNAMYGKNSVSVTVRGFCAGSNTLMEANGMGKLKGMEFESWASTQIGFSGTPVIHGNAVVGCHTTGMSQQSDPNISICVAALEALANGIVKESELEFLERKRKNKSLKAARNQSSGDYVVYDDEGGYQIIPSERWDNFLHKAEDDYNFRVTDEHGDAFEHDEDRWDNDKDSLSSHSDDEDRQRRGDTLRSYGRRRGNRRNDEEENHVSNYSEEESFRKAHLPEGKLPKQVTLSLPAPEGAKPAVRKPLPVIPVKPANLNISSAQAPLSATAIKAVTPVVVAPVEVVKTVDTVAVVQPVKTVKVAAPVVVVQPVKAAAPETKAPVDKAEKQAKKLAKRKAQKEKKKAKKAAAKLVVKEATVLNGEFVDEAPKDVKLEVLSVALNL